MKILVVRFSSIGDIVLTTAVVRCLKKQLNAEVHFLTKAVYTSILEANPFIDKVHTIRADIPEVLPILKKEAFDFIADLHHNLRTFRLKHSLAIPSGQFPKLNIEKWLLTWFKVNKLPDIHIVDRYFEAVKPLKVLNDGAGLDYFIPESEEVNIQTRFPGISPGNFMAFAIGGKYETKKLPVNRIISLCTGIDQPIILLGGEEDNLNGEMIVSKAGPHVQNACGQLSLNGSASVIRQAKKVITHDTGMMHIAAAFQKPVISIWGNTVPAFGMTPYFGGQKSKNKTFEVTGLNCRPCSKLGYRKCPKGHFKCMNDIDLQQILEILKKDYPNELID